jgi:hypothetical protein
MFMKIHLLLFAIFIALLSPVYGVMGGGVPGGWSKANIESPEVQEAAKFAVETRFPQLPVHYKVVSALKQV